jgi:hypothetical protein
MPKDAAVAAGTNNSGMRKVATPSATAPVITPADTNPTLTGLKSMEWSLEVSEWGGCYLGPFKMPGTAVPCCWMAFCTAWMTGMFVAGLPTASG